MPLKFQVLSNFKFKYFFGGQIYCNPNIGFATKCGMQRPKRMWLGVKHTLTNGGECKGWNLITPKCIPILGVTNV